ncbi:MAG TPA: ABC transporter permease [Gaiellaceae bacterium]|nr:ABC transporter permease [Gaiellaceae bacterium]
MTRYLVRRLVLALATLLALSFGSFVAFGTSFDPTYQFNLCGSEECKQQRAQIVAEYHLHDPILSRYWRWLSGFFHHGFGTSTGGFPIWPGLEHALESTAELLAAALVLTLLASLAIGIVSALRPRSGVDVVLRFAGYLSWSIPTVLIAVLLRRWLAPTGIIGGSVAPIQVQGITVLSDGPAGFTGWLARFTLPAVAVALGLTGLYSRYLRSALAVALAQPHVVVARGKGLPERVVVLRHALRTALVPLVSLVSLDVGAAVGATLVADVVFPTRGLGTMLLGTLKSDDPFELTAILVCLGATVLAATFLGDLAIAALDPRTRSAE